jgi:hypothetical protein
VCKLKYMSEFFPDSKTHVSLNQELLRKESSKTGGGFSITFLFVVGLLGIVVGYILKRT